MLVAKNHQSAFEGNRMEAMLQKAFFAYRIKIKNGNLARVLLDIFTEIRNE